MSHKDWRFYYFKPKPIHLPEKWRLIRGLGKTQLSKKGQEKLEWIIFYYSVSGRNVARAALYFGISPKTLPKWIKRFNEKNLSTLEEQSRKPKKTRGWTVTGKEEINVINLRKRNLELGKKNFRFFIKKNTGNTFQLGRLKELSENTISTLIK